MKSYGPENNPLQEIFDKLLNLEEDCKAIVSEKNKEPYIGQYYADIWLNQETALEFLDHTFEKASKEEFENGKHFVFIFHYTDDSIVVFFEHSEFSLRDRLIDIAHKMSAECFLMSLEDKGSDYKVFTK